jgi:flagellar protein FlaE
MSVDPRDYDLNELRKMARKRGGQAGDIRDTDVGLGSVGTSEEAPPTGGSLRQGLYRELMPLGAGGDATKPYLEGLPRAYAGEHLVVEWLEFLLEHAGYQRATEAIDYYESIDWITEDVRASLGDYLLGLDDTGTSDGTDLDVDDHLLSLVYIAKLSAMQ